MATIEEMQTWQERADAEWKEARTGSLQETAWFQQGTLAELCLQLAEMNKHLQSIALQLEAFNHRQEGT